ncbi:MAG TPA: DPP IV N-terminal domain-containing protein, partial [Pyrinomonadaceae bacterium]|nr:DPP IV N-terminal domain-containing protein [Pyrinomonadaceae bacterium]
MTKPNSPLRLTTCVVSFFVFSVIATAQGTLADYDRAQSLQTKFQAATINLPGAATWIPRTNHFWYRRSVTGGNEVIWVDAESLTRRPAFDHEKLAASLSAVSGEKYTALKLPVGGGGSNLTFVDAEQAIEFIAANNRWKCNLTDYKCTKLGPANTQGFNTPAQFRPPVTRPPEQPKTAPDGKWEAFIKNYNIFIRAKDSKDDMALSFDGSEGNYYALNSIVWSPNSKKIAAYRVRPGYHRKIQYVESSPADQEQPKYWTIEYAKPG